MPSKQSSRPPLPSLRVPREQAAKDIKEQMTKGRRLSNRSTRTKDETHNLLVDVHKWITYNKEMLTRFFDSPLLARQFDKACGMNVDNQSSWRDFARETKGCAASGVLFLETISERLRLIPESVTSNADARGSGANRDVFIVHGHSNEAKEGVARFLERLGLRAIILHEQPSLNRTIIEKLEGNANVNFAVVILTPDDLGYPMGRSELIKTRARQNVIFELGFFIGRLGRAKVCALYKGEVELPSDYSGVVYLPLDDAGAWKISLANEVRASGLDVDLNRAY